MYSSLKNHIIPVFWLQTEQIGLVRIKGSRKVKKKKCCNYGYITKCRQFQNVANGIFQNVAITQYHKMSLHCKSQNVADRSEFSLVVYKTLIEIIIRIKILIQFIKLINYFIVKDLCQHYTNEQWINLLFAKSAYINTITTNKVINLLIIPVD